MLGCVRIIKTEADALRHRRALRSVTQVTLSPRFAILGVSRFADCIWHLVSSCEKHESALRALSSRATPVGRGERKSEKEVRREIPTNDSQEIGCFYFARFSLMQRSNLLLSLFFPLLSNSFILLSVEPSP